MNEITISSHAVEQVLKHLNERQELLKKLKGTGTNIDLLKVEILATEATLIGLGINLEKEEK